MASQDDLAVGSIQVVTGIFVQLQMQHHQSVLITKIPIQLFESRPGTVQHVRAKHNHHSNRVVPRISQLVEASAANHMLLFKVDPSHGFRLELHHDHGHGRARITVSARYNAQGIKECLTYASVLLDRFE